MEKKMWVTPELIVLVRSKPEEAVLWSCKDIPSSTGEYNVFSGCYGTSANTCDFQCQNQAGS